MDRKKWTSRVACGALVAAALAGVAVAAGTQGSQDDPLVTLSYLNDTAVPAIMRQVDQKIEQRETALRDDLKKRGGGSFAAVELAAGKTLTLSAGSQALARSEDVKSQAALVDMTDGTTFNGGTLAVNHLYLATGDSQKLTASAACTVLVLGGYTVS